MKYQNLKKKNRCDGSSDANNSGNRKENTANVRFKIEIIRISMRCFTRTQKTKKKCISL